MARVATCFDTHDEELNINSETASAALKNINRNNEIYSKCADNLDVIDKTVPQLQKMMENFLRIDMELHKARGYSDEVANLLNNMMNE